MAVIGICHCCQYTPVSSEADACPRCGQRRPYHSPDQPVLADGSVHTPTVVENAFQDDGPCMLKLKFPENQKGSLEYSMLDPGIRRVRPNDKVRVRIRGYRYGWYICDAADKT